MDLIVHLRHSPAHRYYGDENLVTQDMSTLELKVKFQALVDTVMLAQ